MPVDGVVLGPGSAQGADGPAVRHDRPSLMAFVTDAKSEEALRDGLADVVSGEPDIRRSGIRAAIAVMQKQATPLTLIVDVSGEDQPLRALGELSNVVEPDVCVLVVGEIEHLDFYREVTRGLGATEYLAKPLTRDKVARHFGVSLRGGVATTTEEILSGRAVSITGVRGGVGATTIAVNLGWHLGVTMRRHTVVFDPDIHLGSAAFLLNTQPGPGLRMALEAPERIDALLAERAAQPVNDRLHVLAGEEMVSLAANHAPGAAASLLDSLRRRFNFIVADVPFGPVPLYRDLLDMVDQRVLVMDPSLASVRDTVRLLELRKGQGQEQRAIVVLNRIGIPGGLTRRQIEDALKMKVDVAIPDLPRQIANAATMGEPAIGASTTFRTAITDIARQVGSIRLLDSGDGTGNMVNGGKSGFWRKLRGRG